MARHASAPEAELITAPSELEHEDDGDANSDADDQDAADGHGEPDDTTDDAGKPRRLRLRVAHTPVTQAAIFGIAALIVLCGLVGWLGMRTYQSHQVAQQRELFLQSGRQVALDLTTVDFNRVDSDVARILDSATGQFHDDFQRRSGPFADVVRKAQTTSVGTVTGAGVESVDGDAAQVLVALQVKTSNAGGEQPPRSWRMRLSVQKVGDDVKASNVQFVP